MSCFCLKMKNGKFRDAQKDTSGKLRGTKTRDNNSITRFESLEIEEMTRGFSGEDRIAENEFASVYRVSLPSGKLVAVKHIKPGAIQEESQFIKQIEKMKRAHHHRNLIPLLGYCSTQGFQALVSEFAQNENLSYHLHASKSGLSWDIRVRIAMGVAHALIYLHSEGITHCDIKPSNILLNSDFDAQVADFGCTKLSLPYLYEKIDTPEYIAPDYGIWGKCTDMSDVYSFGVVLVEILSGRVNDKSITNEYKTLAAWSKARIADALESGDFSGLVDPKLKDEYNKGDVYKMAKAIVGCIKYKPEDRPTMKEVLAILEGEADLSYKLVRSESSLNRERGYAISKKILLENRERYDQARKKYQQTEEQLSRS